MPKPKAKPAPKRSSRPKKAGGKSGRVPTLIPMPHGGALWCGPPANPVAGTGRPANWFRQRAAELLDEERKGSPGRKTRFEFAAEVLDGEHPEAKISDMQAAWKELKDMVVPKQSETVSPEEAGAKLARVLTVFADYVIDGLKRPREEVDAVLNRMRSEWGAE